MKIVKTPFKDLIIIRNKRYDDSRGYFRELLIEKKINKKFCNRNFIKIQNKISKFKNNDFMFSKNSRLCF